MKKNTYDEKLRVQFDDIKLESTGDWIRSFSLLYDNDNNTM